MADRSKIEWTDASWNPIRARNTATGKVGWHCERATTGCAGCYAEAFNRRLGTGLPFKPGHLDRGDVELFLDERMLLQPLRWTRPRTIFVCSMTDLFGRFVPDLWLDRIFAVAALTPQHDYQIVTKRSERMREYWVGERRYRDVHPLEDRVEKIADAAGRLMEDGDNAHDYVLNLNWPLPNVWLGVSAERQEEADARIPDLLQTPAAVRFISAEPLLGPIDLLNSIYHGEAGISMRGYLRDRTEADDFRYHAAKLDWVIAGGESGRNARPMHPDWARSLRDQCQAAGVAFFFKQWGEWAPAAPEDCADNPRSGWMANAAHPHAAKAAELYPEAGAAFIAHVGKQAAGRLLDGIEHNDLPKGRAS
ncbi:phage Gp37/Gp68 family protein [Bradyrhizobium sp. SZCCHNR2032]|uniref:DUF5131 family protein n=1 Tax=Bradyrhizobium sp. SZCCHNR2032 TaxID=3057384 RepID=UPI002916FEBF|nr:phage Gp37/Gp68 family protein [Bradyrhizobium sp. SZCCHNR2032]